MNARRLRTSLRGWGGVGAMAVVCALAAVFALLLPVSQSRESSGTGVDGQGVARGEQAKAEDCVDPQDQSLAPDSGPQDGETIQRIKKNGYLTVGVDQNSYRFGYRDPNSTSASAKLEGFDIDLAQAIADEIVGKKENNVHFKAIPTNERIPAIQDGKVDMVVRTMTINCKRLEDVAFSSPYFETGQQVLAPKKSDIKGYDDTLAGKRICSASGSIALEKLQDDLGKVIPKSADISTVVPNQLDCLVRLQLGEVDAVVTDGALAASQAAQDPTVQLKGEPFTDEYYGVAMKKDATDLIRRVNQILVDYRKADWQKSYDTWLAGTLGESDGPPPVQYK
ncbi:polar amino acid transport system substrate-binding protein [Streptomyces umbrinus]|uniref:glutamate ABC transporter substrate-binding protein n=1 Tax=Streptomyces umbrinus TaxID=67370 RepID=UPI00167CDCCA|nr:glutamate ABC transporter substrate-binding protein [Streptomyces umbrinus]MCR3730680.1 polar amino acid transport system substrate-binding protein [Streptomyces umbrinus]GHH38340.1 sugar-binding protein [Streptomyces umbrinus]